MIKSQLVQHIASQYPHLYQRDIEKVVSAILDEMVEALCRGDRVELRGFGAFSSPHGTQPAYWRRRPGLKESRSPFQNRKRDASAA